MDNRKIFLYLLAIVLGGLLLRLVFYTGLCSSDEYKYAQHAYELQKIKETMKEDLSLYREHIKTGHKFFIPPTKLFFPIYVPTAFLYKVFGVSTWTTLLWPFLCSLGKIIVVFLLAKRIFLRDEIGLLAAGLVACFPLSTIFATRLTPDEISNFFTGLTILFFLKSPTRKLWGFLAGLTLGWTYMGRCYVLILFLPFLIYALMQKKLLKILLPLISGFLVVFAMENIFFLYFHLSKGGPFIFRLKVERDMMFYLINVMEPRPALVLIKKFPKPFFDFRIMGLYYYFLPPVLFSIISAKKFKKIIIPFTWFFYYLLCLWFLPIDWKSYLLPVRATRYLDMLTIPMVLILAFFIYEIMRRYRFLGKGLMILFLVTSFYSMTIQIYGPNTKKFRMESFKMTADILKVIAPRTVYCDKPNVSTKINYYFNFNPPFKLKRSVKIAPANRDVYVLIHDFRKDPPTDKEGIIRSIKTGEVSGGRTAHLWGDDFDLSKWILLNVIKGRGGIYIYLFHIPPSGLPSHA